MESGTTRTGAEIVDLAEKQGAHHDEVLVRSFVDLGDLSPGRYRLGDLPNSSR